MARYQPKLDPAVFRRYGGRIRGYSTHDPRGAECIERDAIRWNCSRNWIKETIFAAFYGYDIAKPQTAKARKAAKHRRKAS